jgi:hypothetical protein
MVFAQEPNDQLKLSLAARSVPTGMATVSNITVPPQTSVQVIPVYAASASPKKLVDIAVTQKVVETEKVQEQEAYSQIKKRITKASQAEQPLLFAQLSEQRARVLYSILNNVIVVFHRVDYIVERMDGALLRLRTMYVRKADSGKSLPYFSSRLKTLENELEQLKFQRDGVAAELDSTRNSVNLADDIRASMGSVRKLIQNMRTFLQDYLKLAREVVSL